MPQSILVEDHGLVEFPDDATPDEIQEVLRRDFPSPPLTVGDRVKQAVSSFGSGLTQSFTAIPKAIATGADWLDRNVLDLTPGDPSIDERALMQLGTGIEERARAILPAQDPRQANSFMFSDLPQGAGQLAGTLVGGGLVGAGGKLAGRSAISAMLRAGNIQGATAEFIDAYDEARRHGDDPDTAFKKSVGYASIATAIENRLGTGRLMRKYFGDANAARAALDKIGIAKEVSKDILTGFAEESSQRLAQDLIITGTPNVEGIAREGAVGAILQGLFGIPGNIRRAAPVRPEDVVESGQTEASGPAIVPPPPPGPPADTSPDALAELQASMRGNQVRHGPEEQIIRPDMGSLQKAEADFAPAQEPEPPAPAAKPPTIKSGQKQGDLLGSGDVEFNLYGERTGDGDRATREAATAEQAKREGEEFARKNQMELGAKPKPQRAAVDDADAIERALDALKIAVARSKVQLFGLLPDVWNQVIELVRTAYRAGKSVKQAIDSAFDWARGQGQFDEPAARAELERVIKSDVDTQRPEARIARLDAEMKEMEARGETIPREKLQDYVDAVNEHAEEARAGRASMRGPAAQVDENVEQREGAPTDPTEPPPSPARRIPPFRGEERLPHDNPLRSLLDALINWRQKTGDWWNRRGARMDITIGRDAGDNKATQAANQASLQVRLILNRAFGATGKNVRTKNELREAALTFAVEADMNRDTLAGFYDEIASSDHASTTAGKQALAAIEYAEAHWAQLRAAAERYKLLTTSEREIELNDGVNSHEWEGGYVYHRWKRDAPASGADPTQSRPAATPFRKPRSVPSYAAGIASGRVPLTLNAMELLAGRVDAGQKRLNELRWIHGLRSMSDPVNDLPVAVDVIRKPRRPAQLPRPESPEADAQEQAGETYKPEWVSIAPEGYVVWRSGDLEVAIHENFAGLLTKLTAPSFFKGAGAKKVFGFIKSALLMFDTFHLGRMAAWRQMFGLGGGYQKGQTLLDFTTADIREMAQRGEIPEAWVDGLIENKRLLGLAVDTGFNIGNVLDNAWGDVLHNLPGIGTFNKWLFGQYQRGAMAEAWLIEFARMRKAMPNMSERALARKVSWDLNRRFGNLNRQGLFKSRTAQDLARFVFLAPQWNESLIRSEVGAIGQTLRAPVDSVTQRRIVAGTLMKATGLMALGTFVANQILNYAFRGQPTWENDEEGWDKKISAWIPDVISGGPGFFLNPLALPAEYTHLIEGNLHRSGGDASEAFLRIFNSRLHPVSRAGSIFVSRRDVLGQKLRDGEVLPAMMKAVIPAPIASGTAISAGKQLLTGEPSESFPGQYQKQIMASFGVKTDQAPNAEQRIRTLARDFNKENGIEPHAEFFTGDFTELSKALRIGNKSDASDALKEVLLKKTPKQVAEHYRRWVAAPFTGQQAREREFWQGLNAEQRERYTQAREERRKTALAAIDLLRESLGTKGD